MDELATLTEERLAITRAQGFGDDIHAYRRSLAEDASNQAASQAELVARATEDIGRANAVAPTVFGRLPRATCEVRPVEEFKEKDAPFAYYFPPTIDGSRPGIYYVNTYDLPSRTYSKLASTTFHEAIPATTSRSASRWSTPASTCSGGSARMVAGAYIEGWGLYAERLADELGLYRSAAERFGMLDAQAWPRIAPDRGLGHDGLGWTRRQSIDWLLGDGPVGEDAVIETDRYIVWPGQA